MTTSFPVRLVLLTCLAVLGVAAPAARADGIFLADCQLSHRSAADPIVFPGMRGAHLHDFFGNVTTRASSTTRSLRAAKGNCIPADDHSAYWTPTLFRGGHAQTPVKLSAYYKDFFRFGRVLPFPTGLRMVAGSPHAKAPQQGIIRWSCENDQVGGSPSRIPRCGDDRVTLRVLFPDCWDGRRLDSPDHQSHMAYNTEGGQELGLQRCPASHPVVVPQLQLNFVYPMHDGRGVVLSSGPPMSAHADFFNAWKPAALKHQVNYALNDGRACSPILGCATLTGPSGEPVVARPRGKLVDRRYPPRRHAHR